MDYYLSFVSVASILVAGLLSRFITQRIIQLAARPSDQKSHLHALATPAGSAILFTVIFAALWFAVSLVLVIPWWLAQAKAS